MRAPQYKPNRRFGFNMTPMIDVVFLLIIFFLVSSHLARRENNLELPLPVAASGEEDIDQTTPRVTINLQSDGKLSIGGREVLANRLARTLNEVRQKEGDGVEVRIRGSRQAPYSAVEPIMLACTDAKIWNITFAVYREDQ
jgi:biopolymer transport protein ExbD